MFHTVIGVYGVSGSGKSHALKGIQKVRPEWRCLDGSSIIEEVLKSQGKGLCDFGAMDEQQKIVVRNNAIQMVQSYSGLTLIAGHASFPDDSSKTMSDVTFNNVFTKGDAQTYRAILYLDRDPEQIFQQRKADNDTKKKHRDCLSVENLQDWIHHEKELLRRICKDSGIDFGLVKNENDIVEYIVNHILPPLVQEVQNKSEQALSLVIHQAIPLADVYLLLDGDRTLSPNDTSKTFFESLTANDLSSNDFPLKQIFTRYPDYTFQAFLEVAMLYGCCTSHAEYKRLSHDVGTNKVQLHQAWIDFLTKLPPNVHPIIVSSGNREIWSDTLQNLLSTTQISIIAGNHIGLHPYIIDSKAKAIVVTELRQRRKGCKIFSFGDSAVDVPMLELSDRGYIVLDDRCNRSMIGFISNSISYKSNVKLFQLNLSETAPSSDLHVGIQVGCLTKLLQELCGGGIHSVMDCSKVSTAAAVLATQTRRADLLGPDLQRFHCRVGSFLADKLLDIDSNHNLVQKGSFPHVQGTHYDGFVPTCNLVIIPLMRAGEPMSRGVYERFPQAKLVHYYNKEESHDRLSKALVNKSNDHVTVNDVIIVDSVVNEGKTVRNIIRHIQSLVPREEETPRIHVLTSVMQKEASLRLPLEYPLVRFLALRVSDNKYKGRGGTDTGNRLFGTC